MKQTKSQTHALKILKTGAASEEKGHESEVLKTLIQAGYAAATAYTTVDGRFMRKVYITTDGLAALERSEGASPWQDPSIFDDAKGRN